MTARVSVVIATRNRVELVARLVAQLDRQRLPEGELEVIVVDDGSDRPAAPTMEQVPLSSTMELRTVRIDWSGPARARHHGARLALGDVLVFLDDDMQIGPDFVAAHLRRHIARPGTVVLGHIRPAPAIATMPLFERYHARQLDRWRQAVCQGVTKPRGVHLCTGNVSMQRTDYLAVGGFDPTLERSEDRELGVRLEKHGCRFEYAEEAASQHCSDHDDLEIWLRRAYLYGRFDQRIHRLHPDEPSADPARFRRLIHPLGRPLATLASARPALGRMLGRAAYRAATVLDRLGARRRSLDLVALAYALQYFAGVRHEEDGHQVQAPTGARAEFQAMVAAIRADHATSRYYRRKYHGEEGTSSLLPDLIRKIGLQMLAFYRVMRCLDRCRVPLAPQLVSRLIRHLYGAEIHWKTRIAPGVSIVHGNGLVLSHAAEVGPECIIFQNVTLGESVEPGSGRIGAPRVGRGVHIGPGATLLGPIEIGAGSKVAAGVVLMRTIPANSRVMPAEPSVRLRTRPTHRLLAIAAEAG